MNTLSAFPITRRWPPRNPDAIQLYSLPTPNGIKVSTALEEMELPYDAHLVSFDRNDQFTPEFLSLNPNNKIPAIIDPHGPDGEAIGLFESGAILLYLAEKSGKLIPRDAKGRWHTIQWVMFQMGGIGPMFGQVGYFHHFAGKEISDPRPLQRYAEESRRLLGVLERQIEGKEWLLGDYTIADISIGPWLRNLRDYYMAAEVVGWKDFPNVNAWLNRFLARPAVQRGILTPARG